MKKVKILLALAMCSMYQSCSSDEVNMNPQEESQEKVVFKDDFETFDSNVWTKEEHEAGWVNQELQIYDAAHVSTGTDEGRSVLILTAERKGDKIYSGRVNSQGKKSFQYGKIEASIKLPQTANGLWPAFWMMPKNYTAWPDDGEIDIMEEVGYDPNVILSTVHCKAYNHSIGTQKSGTIKVPTAQTEFHVYAVEWTEDFIKGYVDGKCYFTFDNDKKGNKNTWPFNAAFYLKLNLAWGGDWGGAQGIDESALPATYEIDYVRVFQKK